MRPASYLLIARIVLLRVKCFFCFIGHRCWDGLWSLLPSLPSPSRIHRTPLILLLGPPWSLQQVPCLSRAGATPGSIPSLLSSYYTLSLWLSSPIPLAFLTPIVCVSPECLTQVYRTLQLLLTWTVSSRTCSLALGSSHIETWVSSMTPFPATSVAISPHI